MALDKYKISISGLNLHHALEYFEREKFKCEGLSRVSNREIIVTLAKSDYKKFKKENFAKTYKISVLQRIGKDNLIEKAIKRVGILLGLVAVFALVYISTSKVYEVHLESSGHVCENQEHCIFSPNNSEKVLSYLETLGIKKGAKLPLNISSREIERDLMKNFKQISGASIKQKGVRVVVEIKEATLSEAERSGDLYSTVSGIVITSEISSGKLLVKNGDVVLAGQKLAERENNKEIAAKLLIRSFVHENIIYDESSVTYEKTGKKTSKTELQLFSLKLKSNQKTPFKLFTSSVNTRYAFYNLFIPIVVKTTLYEELREVKSEKPFSEVEEKLKAELYEKTKQLLKDNWEERAVSFAATSEGSRTRLDCYIETLVEITA